MTRRPELTVMALAILAALAIAVGVGLLGWRW